jgi:ATP-dependent 26S proteasome regulatory subunit
MMIRRTFVFVLIISFAACLISGCSGNASQQEYNRLLDEYETLQNENKNLQMELYLADLESKRQERFYQARLDENEKMRQEEKRLSEENERLAGDNFVNAKLTGAFVASVRHIIPDYAWDSTTPAILILTEYQGSPFLLSGLDERTLSQLAVGNQYYFEIEDTIVGYTLKSEFDIKAYNLTDQKYKIRIKSVREANEEDLGENWPNVVFTAL